MINQLIVIYNKFQISPDLVNNSIQIRQPLFFPILLNSNQKNTSWPNNCIAWLRKGYINVTLIIIDLTTRKQCIDQLP
jgi:hypothetical protein